MNMVNKKQLYKEMLTFIWIYVVGLIYGIFINFPYNADVNERLLYLLKLILVLLLTGIPIRLFIEWFVNKYWKNENNKDSG